MVVVSGEALMDVFAVVDTATGVTLDARIGGSPLNVAIGLARLGQHVAFFGGLSSGFLGERLMRALQDECIDTTCVQRLDAPTTLSLVGLDARGVASYAFYGDGAADRQLAASALEAAPSCAAAYHFGSYAMVVEPVASTHRALVEREHRRALIAYDLNVRLNVEPRLACWQQALAWMLPRTHLLKLSDEDLDRLHPGLDDAGLEALAERWLQTGVALVVLTRGARGATAWHASGRQEVHPVAVSLVDTVGAGDTFQAALLTALAEGRYLSPVALRALDAETLARALAFASRAAALTCSRRGADLPRRADMC